MREFDHQLLRLKQALRLTEDQDVASALGMTKAAFSARKSRGVFPADKVKALAADRPDLKLDARYVLTGQTEALDRSLAALKDSSDAATALALPRREQMLVRDILFGSAIENAELLKQTIDNYVVERMQAETTNREPKAHARTGARKR